MSTKLKTEIRSRFQDQILSDSALFTQETRFLSEHIKKMSNMEKTYIKNLSDLHASFKKNFNTKFYPDIKNFLIGLGNCKLSLSQGLLSANQASMESFPKSKLEKLAFIQGAFKKDQKKLENELGWKISDISETQKKLIRKVSDLKVLEKALPPAPEANPLLEDQTSITESKEDHSPVFQNFQNLTANARILTLNLEKDEIENTIELDCLVFNKGVTKMEEKYIVISDRLIKIRTT
jgi:hypothetical protein